MIEQKFDTLIENISELQDETKKKLLEKTLLAEKKESDLSIAQGRINMLEIGAKKHEKENARTMFGGLIVGAVLGAVFAIIF